MATGDVTELLARWRQGDEKALDALLPQVYAELKRLARRYMRRESAGHLLQPTGLVSEAYLRLVDQTRVAWTGRAHFFAVAAQTMRRILVDHARAERAGKRGGGLEHTGITNISVAAPDPSVDILALDEALQHLARLDPRQSQLVELRYFAGLTIEETAEALDISPATVKREWAVARAWLKREVTRGTEAIGDES